MTVKSCDTKVTSYDMGDSWMKCEGGEDGVCRSPLKVGGPTPSPSAATEQ